METLVILELIAILVLGYLSAHFVIGRLQTRFFILTGIEYILLGVLVGPHVTNVMQPEVVSQLDPIISLSIGSLGLLYGLQFRFRDLFQNGAAVRLGFVEVLVTFGLVAGVFAAVFWWLPGFSKNWNEIMPAALVLGTTAAVSAPTAIQAVRKRYNATGDMPDLLQFTVRFDQALGIMLFGLIFCFFHIGQTQGIRTLTVTEWVAVSLGFGIVLGLLFYLFLGREESKSKLLVALLGIVVFASGVAYYLNLSPLFINLVLGIMLANTSKIRRHLIEILRSIEQPIVIVVLVLAGAAWNVAALPALWYVFAGLALLYLLLRTGGKQVGGYVTYATAEEPERFSSRIGAGLIAQGGVAVAMVVNYTQVYQNDFTTLVVTCVLVSVIASEFLSPRLARDMLVDAEQIAIA